MEVVLSSVATFFKNILSAFSDFSIGDALDILILTFVLYKVIQLLRESRSGQLIKGIALFLLLALLASWLNMNIMSVLLDRLWQVGVFALIVLFQPELRHILEQIGHSHIGSFGRTLTAEEAAQLDRDAIEKVCRACMSMQASKTGALIVFENKTILNDIALSGTTLEADTSVELLCNIFFPKAPLHDGAVIIRNGKVYSAACILPLTQNTDLKRELGTRHRAAIGMSENSDAAVVVVSEETGTISMAYKGILTRDFDAITLKPALEKILIADVLEKESNGKKFRPWKRWFK